MKFRSFFLALLGLLCFLALSSAVPVPIKNCGSTNDPAQIQRFDVTPWPIKTGQNITLEFVAEIKNQIDDGVLNYDVTVMKIIPFKGELKLSDHFGKYLPIRPGHIKFRENIGPIPEEIGGFPLKGLDIAVKLNLDNQKNERQFCFSLETKLE